MDNLKIWKKVFSLVGIITGNVEVAEKGNLQEQIRQLDQGKNLVEFEDYSEDGMEVPNPEDAINQIISGKSSRSIQQYTKAALIGLLNMAQKALSIATGRNQARVFETVAALDAWLAVPENVQQLNIGDHFYIVATDVPDYWWDGKQKQVLEAQKVDLTTYDQRISELKESLSDTNNSSTINDVMMYRDPAGVSRNNNANNFRKTGYYYTTPDTLNADAYGVIEVLQAPSSTIYQIWRCYDGSTMTRHMWSGSGGQWSDWVALASNNYVTEVHNKLDGKVSELYENLTTYKSANITPTDYIDSITLRRRGYLVEMSFGKTTKAIPKQTETVSIGTVPEEYRPRVSETRMISATLNGVPVYVAVGSGGSISMRINGDIGAGTNMYAAIQYIGA